MMQAGETGARCTWFFDCGFRIVDLIIKGRGILRRDEGRCEGTGDAEKGRGTLKKDEGRVFLH